MEDLQTKLHSSLKTVELKNNKVVMIDQTKLPSKLEFVEFSDYHQVTDAIKTWSFFRFLLFLLFFMVFSQLPTNLFKF